MLGSQVHTAMPSSLSAFQWLPVVSINNVTQLAGVSLAAPQGRGVWLGGTPGEHVRS